MSQPPAYETTRNQRDLVRGIDMAEATWPGSQALDNFKAMQQTPNRPVMAQALFPPFENIQENDVVRK